MKLIYILTLFVSMGLFNSCGEKVVFDRANTQEYRIIKKAQKRPDNVYGTYLAGRIAHMRQSYDTAAAYYIKSLNLGTKSDDLVSNVYLLLASEGNISKSAEYALKAQQAGDKSNLIAFILMTENMKQNRFDVALENTKLIEDKPFKDNILPLFQAWIYASLDQKQEALEILEKLKKEKSLHPLYHMHRGMINDYFGDTDAAFADYEVIVNDEALPLSFRFLEIIGNFYIRNGQKDKILDVARKYSIQNQQTPLLESLVQSFEQAQSEGLRKYIDTPQKGFAEAMFNVGTIFRGFQNEAAQLFTSLVLYLNDDFDVARVSLGELYEQAHRNQRAIDEYLKIKETSPVYYVAQLKIATNYAEIKQQEKAFETLTNLLKNYPSNEQITFRLGELSRVMGKYLQATDYYLKTLDKLPLQDKDRWLIYYALGISYERQQQWDKAEDAFQKALELSNRHPIVLNYLGYSWLDRDINTDEAIFMVFEAHYKAPEDGHIIDSLGWALYKMGKYQDAVKVLERASEYLPSNAVIFDHLGDAYWYAGRKNEARFQWGHALQATEDKEDLDENFVRQKIENGLEKRDPVTFDESLLLERLKKFEGQK